MKFLRSIPARVAAMFDSDCPECPGEIVEGDWIAFDETSGEWMHYECLIELMEMEQ